MRAKPAAAAGIDRLCRLAVALLIVSSFGCGQMGPLTLPDRSLPTGQTAASGDTATTQAESAAAMPAATQTAGSGAGEETANENEPEPDEAGRE